MCAVIDHVVPLAKGGHPSLIENLQLAHMSCNRIKSDKLFADNSKAEPKTVGNRNLPQSQDWSKFICAKSEGGRTPPIRSAGLHAVTVHFFALRFGREKVGKIKCEICGKSFVRKTSRSKYCSDKCRSDGNREKNDSR